MCVPPSRATGMSKRTNLHHGSGLILRRNGNHITANNQTLVWNEIIRSDQAIFQPFVSLPRNFRKMSGSIVFCQAAWISNNEHNGFCPNRKKVLAVDNSKTNRKSITLFPFQSSQYIWMFNLSSHEGIRILLEDAQAVFLLIIRCQAQEVNKAGLRKLYTVPIQQAPLFGAWHYECRSPIRTY